MKTIKTTIIALGAIALAGAAAPALAEAPAQQTKPEAASSEVLQTYGFVDMRRVMQETAARSVNEELKTKQNQIEQDYDKKAQALRAEMQPLMKQRSSMSKEDFESKAKPLTDKMNKLQESRKHDLEAFASAADAALGKVHKLIGDTVEEVAQDKRLAAVFSRDAVIIGAKNLDITDDVIKRLNDSGKKVAVDWSATRPAKK